MSQAEQQLVKIKLAAALQLRKQLMAAQEINHNVPLDQSVSIDMKKFNGVNEEIKALSYYPIMDVIGPMQYNKLATFILDTLVHTTNVQTSVTIPVHVYIGDYDTNHNPKDIDWTQVTVVSLDQALLRRTYLQAMVEKLTFYCDNALKEPTLTEDRMRPGMSVANYEPRSTLKYNSFLREEAVRALNFYQARLGRLDIAIQEKNWSVDVEIPGWIQDHYGKVPQKSLKFDSLPS